MEQQSLFQVQDVDKRHAKPKDMLTLGNRAMQWAKSAIYYCLVQSEYYSTVTLTKLGQSPKVTFKKLL